ncbi:MAG: hypothetical protein JNK56_28250 [Myxococcales bacterium]|nr:hypothetical protein [Myxococcales bacterium]
MRSDDTLPNDAPPPPRGARMPTDSRWVIPPLILGRRALAAVTAPGLPIGHRLGDYVVAELRGRDGCCTTYVVTHFERGSLHLARVVRDEHQSLAPAILAAARLVQQHPHRNLLTILDTGHTAEPTPHAYIIHERLVGRSLTSLLSGRGGLEWPLVLAIGLQCAEALATLHRIGLAHTAVRPENAALVHIAGDQFRVVLGGLDHAEAIKPGASAIQDPRVRDDLDSLARLLVALTAASEASGSRAPELLTNLLVRTIDPRPAIRPANADELHDLLCVVRDHIDPDLSGVRMLGEAFKRIASDDFEVSIEADELPPARAGNPRRPAASPAPSARPVVAHKPLPPVAPPPRPARRWPALVGVALVSLLAGAALRDLLGAPATANHRPSSSQSQCSDPAPIQSFLRRIPEHRPAVTTLPHCEDPPAPPRPPRLPARAPTPPLAPAAPAPATAPQPTPEPAPPEPAPSEPTPDPAVDDELLLPIPRRE